MDVAGGREEKGVGDPSYSKSAVDRRKRRLGIRQRMSGGGIGEQTENVRGKGKRSLTGVAKERGHVSVGKMADRWRTGIVSLTD